MVGWRLELYSLIHRSTERGLQPACVRPEHGYTTAFSANTRNERSTTMCYANLIRSVPANTSLAGHSGHDNTRYPAGCSKLSAGRYSQHLIDLLVLVRRRTGNPVSCSPKSRAPWQVADTKSRYGRYWAFLAESSGYTRMRAYLEDVLAGTGDR